MKALKARQGGNGLAALNKRYGRPGRPPLPEGHAKASVLALRLTNAERAAIEAAAERAGVTVTTWARDALLTASQTERSGSGGNTSTR